MVELDFGCIPNLKHIFECGQCFRWEAEPLSDKAAEADGSYIGVVGDEVVRASVCGSKVILEGTDNAEFWADYFDVSFDYESVKAKFNKDKTLKSCMEYGYGIRILKQDLFETVISFIISANSNIPKIKSTIEKLCKLAGTRLRDGYYMFPTAEQIVTVGVEKLRLTGAGYRCKYIFQTALAVANGEINLENLREAPTDSAKNELIKLPGVGDKVANCILLFGLHRFDTFPIDVWVKRLMDNAYGVAEKDISKFSVENFGEYRGLAQQYLFYYHRGKN